MLHCKTCLLRMALLQRSSLHRRSLVPARRFMEWPSHLLLIFFVNNFQPSRLLCFSHSNLPEHDFTMWSDMVCTCTTRYNSARSENDKQRSLLFILGAERLQHRQHGVTKRGTHVSHIFRESAKQRREAAVFVSYPRALTLHPPQVRIR